MRIVTPASSRHGSRGSQCASCWIPKGANTGRTILAVRDARAVQTAAITAPSNSSPSSTPASPAAPEAAPPVPSRPHTHGPVTGAAIGDLWAHLKKLQNGSDIRGIALEGVPGQPITLTPGAVFFIGHGFVAWLKSKGHAQPHVSIGHDPRLSGPLLQSAFTAGLLAGGAAGVYHLGLATTPACFYSILHSRAVGASLHQAGAKDKDKDSRGKAGLSQSMDLPSSNGAAPAGAAAALAAAGHGAHAEMYPTCGFTASVMLTASHLPFNSNGLKFFTLGGGLDKADIADILQNAALAAAEAGVMIGDSVSEQTYMLKASLEAPRGRVHALPFLPEYAAFVRGVIVRGVQHPVHPQFPLLGTRIVVDAGHGSGGFFAEQVLAPLGADVTGSQYLSPDGTFPAHPPNPEHPAAMAAGAAAVRSAKADLGVVFDTDVDRSAIVDASGREINSNRFIALMAAVVLRENPGTTIVTDSVTSNGLTEFIQKLGGRHFRYKRGYKNVIGQGMKLNQQGVDCALMMETSGHGALRDNYFLDDGAYLAVKAIIEFVRLRASGEPGGLSELLSDLKEPLESREVRIRINDTDFKAVGAEVLKRFNEYVTGPLSSPRTWSLESVNHEGWRVNVDEGQGRRGWLLLRQSLHDPLLVLNMESEVEGGVDDLVGAVAAWLAKECADMPLDVSALPAPSKH